ncbi:hypothetical protein TBLA_0H00620 [Henningerozyma blattae CBS 6284]|uniref:Uncharacterized protein n=1 Tax=Henningerozyma blattae (strain ATCC 34711 / CBS 6284 / DSM 70876 / NBRC 10599 / NRRL Y-10934 / UCD 77-7) TaxID=1071380 RepID=I2H7K1_HENB6|nr:hypothetical protein TBLA_0H00620 [Tetrapisispora blattae CBS 6284]CCH62353.1 hypothetical protein TBLA_0H00620 [Tetrapisispora blattae CBS 6284]
MNLEFNQTRVENTAKDMAGTRIPLERTVSTPVCTRRNNNTSAMATRTARNKLLLPGVHPQMLMRAPYQSGNLLYNKRNGISMRLSSLDVLLARPNSRVSSLTQHAILPTTQHMSSIKEDVTNTTKNIPRHSPMLNIPIHTSTDDILSLSLSPSTNSNSNSVFSNESPNSSIEDLHLHLNLDPLNIQKTRQKQTKITTPTSVSEKAALFERLISQVDSSPTLDTPTISTNLSSVKKKCLNDI